MVLIAQGLGGFYKAFGLEMGMSDDFLAHVGAVAALFNCLGRFIFGWAVDHLQYKWLAVLEACSVMIVTGTNYAYVICLMMHSFYFRSQGPFYWISFYGGRWCFAAALCFCYLNFSGIFATIPAVCAGIFDPSTRASAIGLVYSADVINNVVIGACSHKILDLVGWQGYFAVLASTGITVIAANSVFPGSI